MATDLKSLQATGDTLLQAGVAKAQSFQDNYLINHGRYAQCVQTPGVIPSDGAKFPTDKTERPYYQLEDWNALGFALPAISEVSVRIDTYDGPKGKDWCAVATFIADGVLYTKSVAAKGVEAPTFDWVASKVPTVIKADVGSIIDPVVVDAAEPPLQKP